MDPRHTMATDAEAQRLDAARIGVPWRRWGPYLAERAWGTVREDYSADGDAWGSFDHEQARSRAYRWNEDGLLGISDDQQRLCLALCLWNETDPILKERLFGLTNAEGNHGEDVKEVYFYLDALPSSSYLRAAYIYPQRAFPYQELRAGNAGRSTDDPEYELLDTGVLEEDRFFDVEVVYAKRDPDSLLMRVRATNMGPEAAPLHILPTAWFRNTWAWGDEVGGTQPSMRLDGPTVMAEHPSLGRHRLAGRAEGAPGAWIFTDNETNTARAFGLPAPDGKAHAKDAFHRYLIAGDVHALNASATGTKAAFHGTWLVAPGATVTAAVALVADEAGSPLDLLHDGEAIDRGSAHRGGCVLRAAGSPIHERGRATRSAPGPGRPAVVDAVLRARRRPLAAW